MKRNAILTGLLIVVVTCSLMPAAAEAQFIQQGPKPVGTGAVGGASRGVSVSLSGDGNTAIAEDLLPLGTLFDFSNISAERRASCADAP